MIIDDHQCRGCAEYEMLTRHRLSQQARSIMAPFAAPHDWLPRVRLARDSSSRDTLVVVFLRGGMDSLTSVVPYGDPNLYSPSLRPQLAIQPPGQLNGAVDLDGFFGFSPDMASLLPAYQSGQLMVVHATGSPDPSRSHFDSNQFMEYGIPLQPLDVSTGWLARHLQVTPAKAGAPFRGVAIGYQLPKTLSGAPGTLPIPDPPTFAFPGAASTAVERRAVIEAAYMDADEPASSAAADTLATIDLLTAIDFDNYSPFGGVQYNNSTFGQGMRAIAAIHKAEIGLEVAMIELGGWDTHNSQVGSIVPLMNELSSTLADLHTDMNDPQGHMDSLTLLVMSEFGRRCDENGSSGTDHGHGSCMIVMGGHIDGGRVLADWTDGALLHPDLLYQGDSLQVTTDYRDIVAEILQNRLENTDMATVFPNYSPIFHGITTAPTRLPPRTPVKRSLRTRQ